MRLGFRLHSAGMIAASVFAVWCGWPGDQVGRAADDDKSKSPPTVKICADSEPGDRVTFTGKVLDYRGEPLSKIAVVAYNADKDGLYNPRNSKTRVPRIRGVAITDDQGRFRVETVRPGAYPDNSQPAHIHVVVAAPAHQVRYLTYIFEGDPLITTEVRKEAAKQQELTLVSLKRTSDNTWSFEHEVKLEGN